MGLFSFRSKNQPEDAPAGSPYQSRAEEQSNTVRGRGKDRERKAKGGNSAGDDPLLPEKKRARRRLLGAIALVIAVVIGLPMALDPEPKPLADDIAIQIPSRDKPQPAAARTPQPAPTIAASLDQKEELLPAEKPLPGAAPSAPKPAATVSKDSKPGEAPPQPAPVKSIAHVEPKPEPKEATDPPTKSIVKAETPSASLIDEAARGKAILEGKAEAKPAAKPAGEVKTDKVVLQVAALATQEKINEVQSKLKSAGIQSYTQKIATESGERTRIRIVAANKDEADRLRTKLLKLNLNGTAVAPGH